MAAAVVLAARRSAAAGGLGPELLRSAELLAARHTRVGHTAEATRINAVLPGLAGHLAAGAVSKTRAAARRLERTIDHGRDHGH
jgi:hypothetical protein